MSPPQPPKNRTIMKALRKAGFALDHTRGDHQYWKDPESGRHVLVVDKPGEEPPKDTWANMRRVLRRMGKWKDVERHL